MKIRELDFDMSAEEAEYRIQELIAGHIFTPHMLNKVMKYLHFDDEEEICTDTSCEVCPFFDRNSIGSCITSTNNYVRNLIKGKTRVSLEDML